MPLLRVNLPGDHSHYRPPPSFLDRSRGIDWRTDETALTKGAKGARHVEAMRHTLKPCGIGVAAELALCVGRRNATFRAAVRQRHRDRGDLDFGDTIVVCDPDLLCRGRRKIHDPAPYIWPAVLNGHYRALAGLNVGHLRCGTERKRLACGVVAMRVHGVAIRHFSAGKLPCVERCHANALAARQVRLRPRRFVRLP